MSTVHEIIKTCDNKSFLNLPKCKECGAYHSLCDTCGDIRKDFIFERCECDATSFHVCSCNTGAVMSGARITNANEIMTKQFRVKARGALELFARELRSPNTTLGQYNKPVKIDNHLLVADSEHKSNVGINPIKLYITAKRENKSIHQVVYEETVKRNDELQGQLMEQRFLEQSVPRPKSPIKKKRKKTKKRSKTPPPPPAPKPPSAVQPVVPVPNKAAQAIQAKLDEAQQKADHVKQLAAVLAQHQTKMQQLATKHAADAKKRRDEQLAADVAKKQQEATAKIQNAVRIMQAVALAKLLKAQKIADDKVAAQQAVQQQAQQAADAALEEQQQQQAADAAQQAQNAQLDQEAIEAQQQAAAVAAAETARLAAEAATAAAETARLEEEQRKLSEEQERLAMEGEEEATRLFLKQEADEKKAKQDAANAQVKSISDSYTDTDKVSNALKVFNGVTDPDHITDKYAILSAAVSSREEVISDLKSKIATHDGDELMKEGLEKILSDISNEEAVIEQAKLALLAKEHFFLIITTFQDAKGELADNIAAMADEDDGKDQMLTNFIASQWKSLFTTMFDELNFVKNTDFEWWIKNGKRAYGNDMENAQLLKAFVEANTSLPDHKYTKLIYTNVELAEDLFKSTRNYLTEEKDRKELEEATSLKETPAVEYNGSFPADIKSWPTESANMDGVLTMNELKVFTFLTFVEENESRDGYNGYDDFDEPLGEDFDYIPTSKDVMDGDGLFHLHESAGVDWTKYGMVPGSRIEKYANFITLRIVKLNDIEKVKTIVQKLGGNPSDMNIAIINTLMPAVFKRSKVSAAEDDSESDGESDGESDEGVENVEPSAELSKLKELTAGGTPQDFSTLLIVSSISNPTILGHGVNANDKTVLYNHLLSWDGEKYTKFISKLNDTPALTESTVKLFKLFTGKQISTFGQIDNEYDAGMMMACRFATIFALGGDTLIFSKQVTDVLSQIGNITSAYETITGGISMEFGRLNMTDNLAVVYALMKVYEVWYSAHGESAMPVPSGSATPAAPAPAPVDNGAEGASAIDVKTTPPPNMNEMSDVELRALVVVINTPSRKIRINKNWGRDAILNNLAKYYAGDGATVASGPTNNGGGSSTATENQVDYSSIADINKERAVTKLRAYINANGGTYSDADKAKTTVLRPIAVAIFNSLHDGVEAPDNEPFAPIPEEEDGGSGEEAGPKDPTPPAVPNGLVLRLGDLETLQNDASEDDAVHQGAIRDVSALMSTIAGDDTIQLTSSDMDELIGEYRSKVRYDIVVPKLAADFNAGVAAGLGTEAGVLETINMTLTELNNKLPEEIDVGTATDEEKAFVMIMTTWAYDKGDKAAVTKFKADVKRLAAIYEPIPEINWSRRSFLNYVLDFYKMYKSIK